jgi:putative membrane protein
MLVAGTVLAAVAALVHVYIFVLESVLWRSPRARAVFGTTEEEARVTAPLALNQGFYNLFLTLDVIVGIVLVASGATGAGLTALLIGTGSMVAASLVLLLSDRSKARAALVQGLIPLVAVVLLVICVARTG